MVDEALGHQVRELRLHMRDAGRLFGPAGAVLPDEGLTVPRTAGTTRQTPVFHTRLTSNDQKCCPRQ